MLRPSGMIEGKAVYAGGLDVSYAGGELDGGNELEAVAVDILARMIFGGWLNFEESKRYKERYAYG